MLQGPLPTPVLSVIVPVYNVAEYLPECLDSLLNQTLKRLEVVVVDDGSTDFSPKIIADYAKRDRRIKVITQANAGLGAARNVGIAASTGQFITFLDSDDTIPLAAYAHMVATLKRTGSDFAVGAIRRIRLGKSTRPTWVTNVHSTERLHIAIDDFPDAMQDVIACNRMFRREFWNENIGSFPTGIAYEDHAPMVTAYVRASSFDLLSATTYNWRIRENETSIGQQKHQTNNLRDRVAVKDMAWEVVSREATPQVVAAWLGRVLDIDLSLFVEFAIPNNDEYRDVLQAAARRFIERTDARAWHHVRIDRKLRVALAAAGQWEQADRVIEYFRLNGAIPKTRVVDGRITADLPFADELSVEPELFDLSEHQTSLSACIQRAIWREDGRLEVSGWAFIRAIDLTNTAPNLVAYLVNPATEERVPLDLEAFSSTYITRWANHPNHRYDCAGFKTVVDVDSLLQADSKVSARWQLIVRVESQGVTREGPVRSIVRPGLAMRMTARPLADMDGASRIIPVMDETLGFTIHLRYDRLRAVALESHGAHHLRGIIRILRPLPAPPREAIVLQASVTVAKCPLIEQPDGSFGFALALPVSGRPSQWDFRVVDEHGRQHRVSWPTEHEHGVEIGAFGPGSARWRRSPRGFVQLTSQAVSLRAHHVDTDEDNVVVDVALHGADASVLGGAFLASPLVTVPVSTVEPLANGHHQLRFPAKMSRWGSELALPLPTGIYSLHLPAGEEVLNCSVVPNLMETMPLESLNAAHGVTVARRPGTDWLTITLRAPLREHERGRVAQRRLAETYNLTDYEPREQILFQCYRGEFATDSQRAIHDELYRRGAPIDLVWGIYDLSVEIPAGARAVVMGTQEWYEAIGSSTYLCNNIDFDRFFRRRDHQRFLQTFHGYPFKSMGISFWRSKELSDNLIEFECARRNQAWTTILVPEQFCVDLYRAEYRYDGDVLVAGYPRNDVLVDPDPSLRKVILDRLGVSPDKTVILYAPTWREASVTGAWSAKFFDGLALDTLAAALGEDHVILLRGHNYNMREGALNTRSQATVIDVTRYPEINDLILASDIALLDYSSLRFDWAITGKPMLFFVPDLADYLSARSALYEYGPTAPGPMLSSTAEVIEAIQNIDSVSKKYAPARDRFNASFNRFHDGHATERVIDAFFGPDFGRP
jgi:CDP-glycerol glycerophosphotransferase